MNETLFALEQLRKICVPNLSVHATFMDQVRAATVMRVLWSPLVYFDDTRPK